MLHDLISKIKRICIGFDDHKQEVFNLVQALKTLFLYTQTEKESVDEYAHNFKSYGRGIQGITRNSPRTHKRTTCIARSSEKP